MNGYLFIERETEGRMSRESDDMTVRQRIVVYKWMAVMISLRDGGS